MKTLKHGSYSGILSLPLNSLREDVLVVDTLLVGRSRDKDFPDRTVGLLISFEFWVFLPQCVHSSVGDAFSSSLTRRSSCKDDVSSYTASFDLTQPYLVDFAIIT